ncbi:beta carbonic anhydrase 1 [Lepeophtheirus salmonis]|uniref:Carbonic anhydrase n=3 Tax=Lepeophtheirus salmonis TaxID=72036 RepID=D3PI48_LEPSM|nr:beta carbonic anhydrase 1-like isoform X1 [Lepeophtheirus salmonis]ADD38234.1 Beta carbonic anhydrase 1 [Lepeophtheirus salmonis]
MEKVFRGIIRYKNAYKDDVFTKLSKIKESGSSPSTVLFTCMDARIHPNVIMNSNVGDVFTVRNPGNIVPNASYVANSRTPAPEPAGLELGCVVNSIKNVVVCGHSDCKAMIALQSFGDSKGCSEFDVMQSPLKAWLQRNGMVSFKRFCEMKKMGKEDSLIFMKNTKHEFEARIDSQLDEADQLSQINTLVQMENIYSYDFMKNRIDDKTAFVHGLWFSLTTGDVHYFLKNEKVFINVSEDNIDNLVQRSEE